MTEKHETKIKNKRPILKRSLLGIPILVIIGAAFAFYNSDTTREIFRSLIDEPEYLQKIGPIRQELVRLRRERLVGEWIPLVQDISNIQIGTPELNVKTLRSILTGRRNAEIAHTRIERRAPALTANSNDLAAALNGEKGITDLLIIVDEIFLHLSRELNENLVLIPNIEPGHVPGMSSAQVEGVLTEMTAYSQMAADYVKKLELASEIIQCAVDGLDKLHKGKPDIVSKTCHKKADKWRP